MKTWDPSQKKNDTCMKNLDSSMKKDDLKTSELLKHHISMIFVKYLSRIQQPNSHKRRCGKIKILLNMSKYPTWNS